MTGSKTDTFPTWASPPLASSWHAVPCRAEPCVVMRALVGLTEAHVLSANSD